MRAWLQHMWALSRKPICCRTWLLSRTSSKSWQRCTPCQAASRCNTRPAEAHLDHVPSGSH